MPLRIFWSSIFTFTTSSLAYAICCSLTLVFSFCSMLAVMRRIAPRFKNVFLFVRIRQLIVFLDWELSRLLTDPLHVLRHFTVTFRALRVNQCLLHHLNCGNLLLVSCPTSFFRALCSSFFLLISPCCCACSSLLLGMLFTA